MTDPQSDAGLAGDWWIPGRKANSRPGWLRFGEGRETTLELSGALHFPDPDLGEVVRGRVVLGRDVRGRAITLLNAHSVLTSGSPSGTKFEAGRQTVRAYTVLVGPSHPEGDPLFEACSFSLDGLAEWVEPHFRLLSSGLSDEGAEMASGVGRRILVRDPQETRFEVPGGTLSLFGGAAEKLGDVERSFRVDANWSYRSSAPKTFDELWQEVIDPLKDLHVLVTGEPTRPFRIHVELPDGDEAQRYERRLRAYAYHPSYPQPVKRRPWEWPVTLPQVADRLPTAVSSWLELMPSLRRALAPLFAVLGQERELYLENRYLMLAQAAEAYHRHRPGFTTRIMSESEHDLVLKLLLNTVPTEWQNWLRGRLQYAYEPTFRRRLADLKQYAGSFGARVASRRVIDGIVTRRNDLTHLPTSRNQTDEDYSTTVMLGNKIALLLRACLLRDVGLEGEEIANALTRNPSDKFAAEWSVDSD